MRSASGTFEIETWHHNSTSDCLVVINNHGPDPSQLQPRVKGKLRVVSLGRFWMHRRVAFAREFHQASWISWHFIAHSDGCPQSCVLMAVKRRKHLPKGSTNYAPPLL